MHARVQVNYAGVYWACAHVIYMETVVMREVCIKMFIRLFVLWMIVQNRHVLITGIL